MHYTEIEPHGALRPYVRCFWVLHGPPAAAETILPDGCTELVFHFANTFVRNDQAQPRGLFVGQMTTPTQVVSKGSVDCFGVRFEPAGAWLIFRRNQAALAGKIVTAAEMLGSATERSILSAGSLADRSRLVQSALLARVPESVEPWTAALPDVLSGAISMEFFRSQSGVGLRQLERRFLERVGMSPGLFHKLGRFRQALESRGSWADIAAACGYFDQSHLIRDFHRFAGASPTAIRPDPFLMSQLSKTASASLL